MRAPFVLLVWIHTIMATRLCRLERPHTMMQLRPKAKLHQGRSKKRCVNCKRALNDAGMLMCSIKCKLNAVRESLLRQGKEDNNGGHDGFDISTISLALKETSVSRGREVVNHNEVISSHGCCDGSPSPFKRRKIENGLSMEEKCNGIQVGSRIHNAEFVSPVSPDSVLKSDSSLNALNVNLDKSTLDSSHRGGEEQRPEFTSSQGDYQYKLQHCCHHQNRLHRRNRRKGIPERAPFF
ncbi:hypothetical protein SUGI_0558410 [Cryptomeria japonica]|nr:hypothetical protein SUGI_0558410 [Cryptomeria japonica]